MAHATPTDELRAEHVLAEMYRRPQTPLLVLLEDQAEQLTCGRRQIERAFRLLETGAAAELRGIRADLAAAKLLAVDAHTPLAGVAARVGYPDTRALRHQIARRWDISPGALRDARILEREIASLEEIRRRRGGLDEATVGHLGQLRERRRRLLGDLSIPARRLLEGDPVLPTPAKAAEQPEAMARARMAVLRAASLKRHASPR